MDNISNTSTVQSDRVERVYTNFGVLKVVFIFVLILVILGVLSVLWILKGASFMPEEIRQLVLDTIVCTVCESGEDEEDTDKTTLSLENQGWTLYSYPDYNFKVELPTNSYFSPSHNDSSQYRYVWSIYIYDLTPPEPEEVRYAFPNLSKKIVISYLPISFPDVYTEIDYFGGTTIYVNFFEKGNLNTIEEVESDFAQKVANWQESSPLDDEYTKEFKTVYGYQGFDYSYLTIMFKEEGTLLLTDQYIVQISTTLNFTDGEDLEITNKVLDSMEF